MNTTNTKKPHSLTLKGKKKKNKEAKQEGCFSLCDSKMKEHLFSSVFETAFFISTPLLRVLPSGGPCFFKFSRWCDEIRRFVLFASSRDFTSF
mmetsp:Transcript_60667/g.70347  ORF Transcript_60667/g.70347 Transcript_60667/m.70347 type:complete len:93 (+) Transcript_60667:1414-1692(+)